MMNRKGFALVMTLLVVTLLVAVVVEFVSEVYVDTSLRRNFSNAQQASLLAESGVNGALTLLKRTVGPATYTSLKDQWAQPFPMETDEGTVLVTIEDESGKFNLNSVANANGTFNDNYQNIGLRLTKRLGLSPDLIDAVADWIDADGDNPKPNGGESAFYANLTPPHDIRNDIMQTLEEVALIRGFAGRPFAVLRPFVTVFYERENAFRSDCRINVNTAPKEVLLSLHDDLTDSLAEEIIQYRSATPFKRVEDLQNVAGMDKIYMQLTGITAVKGNVFRIVSQGKVGETTRVVEAVVRIPSQILYWREY